MWWFLSTYNKMDMGGYVRGVFCPYTNLTLYKESMMKWMSDDKFTQMPSAQNQTQIWVASWENQSCGFWTRLTQTDQYSHRRELEASNFGF